jgi:hypothetical protein
MIQFTLFQRMGGRGSLSPAPRGGGRGGQQKEMGRQKRPGGQSGRGGPLQSHALPPLHGHVEESGNGSLAITFPSSVPSHSEETCF